MDSAIMENEKMGELIRRLSELRCQYNCLDETERDAYHTLSEAIKALSDVPDTNVGDTISRQAAIDAVGQYISQFDAIDVNFLDGLKTAINIVKKLPSADVVEVVRCADCKHSTEWYRDKRRCFLWCENGIDVFEDGYCSYWEKKDG